MKTLDEVIEMFTKCTSPVFECRECSYCTGDEKELCNVSELNSDVLHYLKEYRTDKLQWEADRKRYLNWIEQHKEAREKHQQAVIELKRNPPLTWDELKEMEGKPVWIEGPLLKEEPHWIILGAVHLYEGKIVGYGKTWQAYRKERK